MLQQSELIYVKRVKGKGRGVFARRPIAKGTVIENVPVLVVPMKHLAGEVQQDPVLGRFCFIRDDRNVAVALGYGSLYNHSYSPNARYDDGPAATMYFTAIRSIQEGEEITINYNGEPWRRGPVGFDVV